MAITVLNLRSFIAGQKPTTLEAGQICINLVDKLMFIGNGSSTQSDFGGNVTPGTPGLGWFSLPLDLAGFGESFLISPEVYGQLPSDGDTLQWSAGLDHLEWVPSVGPGTGSAGFLMTNAEVTAAAGVDVSQKINNIISPTVAQSGNTAIVQGVSGDVYEGVYVFVGGFWEFAAFYAQPVAAAIEYNNTVSGLASDDVQGAVDELSANKVENPAVAPSSGQVLSWNGSATEWTSDAGGSVTGVSGNSPITVDNSDPTSPVVGIANASTTSTGAVQLNNTVTSTSIVEAGTANSVKVAYDLANIAELDAQQAISDAAAAQSTANTAEANAQQALLDAATAQATASQALLDAADAQTDATQALIDAAAAQSTANAALPKAGGTMSGIINFSGTQPTATILAANIVRLEDGVSSTSITTAATPNSVRAAYDLANAALSRTGGTMTGVIVFDAAQQFPLTGIQNASTTQTGIVQLVDSVTSTTNAYAATPNSVKTAYDAAVAAQATADAALPKVGGTMTGDIVFAPTQTFPTSSIADATTATKGVVQIGTNIGVIAGVISVSNGDTTTKGVVQLTDALNSTSTTLGLTANGGYILQQQIDTLSLLSNLTFCGTINASTGLLTSVTDAGIAHGFTVGLPLPAPVALTDDHFVVVSVPGTFTPTGGSGPIVCNQGDWIVGIEPTPAAYEWSLQPVGYDAPSATTTTEGITFLATDAEVQAGTETSNKAVNPASLQSKLSDSISTTSSTTIASSTAVKTAYDLANAAVPEASFTAKGEVLAGTGAGTYNAVTVGTDGYVLTADSLQTSGVSWQAPPVGPGSAQSDTEGLVYGLTQDSVSGYNVSLGYGANGTLTTGIGNTVIGGASGDITSGSYNVAIGYDVDVVNPAGDKQLAIGPDAYARWLTGDSSMNVKLGAGLRDSTNSLGTSGQVLSSTGTALQWVNNSPDGVQGVTGTTPVTVDNTDPANPVISVNAGTTLATGVIQLEDSVSSTSTTTAATPNSVKTAYDLANAALPKAGGTMSGDITLDAALVDGVGSPGTSGYILSSTATGVAWVANSADGVLGVTGTTPITVDNVDPANPVIGIDSGSLIAEGVLQLTDSTSSTSTTTAATPNSVKTAYDLADAAVPDSTYTALGDLVAGTGVGVYVVLPRGANDQVLAVDSTTPSGLKWVNNTAGSVVGVTGTSPITVDNTDPANPVIGVSVGSTTATGVLQLIDSVSSTSTSTAATPASVKTAYDLANAALPVNAFDAKGDTLIGTGSDTYSRLAVGANNSVLTADSSTATGVKWGSVGVTSVTSVVGGPIQVNNTNAQTPILSITSGSVSNLGVIQLTDSTASTSITTAATPNSVKTAYDLANSKVSAPTALQVSGQSLVVANPSLGTTSWANRVAYLDSSGPITIGGTALTPIVGINSASTASSGAVQLNDSTTSTSITQALTANQGRALQVQIDALAVSSNLTFAGTIDASTGNMNTVSAAGSLKGFTVGSPLPSPAVGNTEYFTIVTVPGTMTPPGGSAQLCHQGDWWLSDGTTWNFLDIGYNASYASTTTPGIIQLATDAEVQSGLSTDLAVVPSSLQSKISDSVTTTSSTTIASSTAAKAAYDLADGALQRGGGTMTGTLEIGSGVTLNLNAGSTLSASGAADFFGASTFANGPVNYGTTSVTFQNDTTVSLDGVTNFITGSLTYVDGDFTFNVSPIFSAGVNIGPAVKVTYDNTTSGLAATEVQGAIDEIANNVSGFIPDTAFAAKGNLLAGTGASTYSALTVGTDGQVLVADSAATEGVSWSDPTIPGLGTPSIVAAADQLGLVYDLSDGKIKSVVAFDSGLF